MVDSIRIVRTVCLKHIQSETLVGHRDVVCEAGGNEGLGRQEIARVHRDEIDRAPGSNGAPRLVLLQWDSRN